MARVGALVAPVEGRRALFRVAGVDLALQAHAVSVQRAHLLPEGAQPVEVACRLVVVLVRADLDERVELRDALDDHAADAAQLHGDARVGAALPFHDVRQPRDGRDISSTGAGRDSLVNSHGTAHQSGWSAARFESGGRGRGAGQDDVADARTVVAHRLLKEFQESRLVQVKLLRLPRQQNVV